MDESEKSQQQYIAEGADQTGNNTPPLPGTPDVVATSNVCVPVSSTMQHPLLSVSTPQHQPAYQEAQAQHMENVRERLRLFWAKQMQEMTAADLKNHSLPLAPIKRIMKADNDVRMIAKETAAVFAKACEMFILDLTLQARINTEEDKRRTIQKKDIATTIFKTNTFDFLEHVIPRDKLRQQILKATNAGQQASSSTDTRIHGYNVTQQHGIGVSTVTSAGGQQPPPFVPWYQPGPQIQIQQSFMSVPQDQSQQNQQLPFIPLQQAQQHLVQQTPEQLLVSCRQAEHTTEQQTSEQFPMSCFLAEQSPDQHNLEKSSPQAEQQTDQQNY